jgi:hypothetical protein
VGRALSYRDAIEVLGGDPPAVAALDRALGGMLSLATGGASEVVLDVFDAQGRIVGVGRDLLGNLRDRIRGTGRLARTRRLAAAHTVIVVTAYFEAFGAAPLPFKAVRPDRAEQLRLRAAVLPATAALRPTGRRLAGVHSGP